MGPYPHAAARAAITPHNPMGTNGFAFVEFASPDPQALHAMLRLQGFTAVAKHRAQAVTLYRQGSVDYLVNEEPGSHAMRFAASHGPSVPAMGFLVADAAHAYARAVALAAEAWSPALGTASLAAPAIAGIGGSLIYFIEEGEDEACRYGEAFIWLDGANPRPAGHGLYYIDHLTHNVGRGRMDHWAGFYERLFNFREVRYFDIKGEYSGLFSRAMTSPDGRIRIPINESADAHSQIEEYLRAYGGEGIQHIACGCRDIVQSVAALRRAGLPFMPAPPPSYYERIDQRVPGHGLDLARLAENGLLLDGTGAAGDGRARVLLQIFSANLLGPVFFEFIERRGDEGFGEGNFRALFLSIEEDQRRRGVIGAAGEARDAKLTAA